MYPTSPSSSLNITADKHEECCSDNDNSVSSFANFSISTIKSPKTIVPNSSNPLQVVINSETIKIKDYSYFQVKINDGMPEYFLELINKIYPNCNYNFNIVIEKIKADRSKIHSNIYSMNKQRLYNFLAKLTKFASVSFTTCYNEITDSFNYFMNKLTVTNAIKPFIIMFFNSLEFKQIEKIAKNKDLYRYIKHRGILEDLSIKNLNNFSEKRKKSYIKVEKKFLKITDECRINSRKILLKKYTTDLLKICRKKDIDIENKLISIIKLLTSTDEFNDIETEEILIKITNFFQAFNDENVAVDTSILTDIICNTIGQVDKQLLLTILNITDEQMKIIGLQNKILLITKTWLFKGFPTTEKIDKQMGKYKVDIENKTTVIQKQAIVAPTITNTNESVTDEKLDFLNTDIVPVNEMLAEAEVNLENQQENNKLSVDNNESLNISAPDLFDELLKDNSSFLKIGGIFDPTLEEDNLSDIIDFFSVNEELFSSLDLPLGDDTEELINNKRSVDSEDDNPAKRIKYSEFD